MLSCLSEEQGVSGHERRSESHIRQGSGGGMLSPLKSTGCCWKRTLWSQSAVAHQKTLCVLCCRCTFTWNFEKLRKDAPASTHHRAAHREAFSILMGLSANKGQQALMAHNENACVLLKAIWLGHEPLSRRGWLGRLMKRLYKVPQPPARN